MLCLLSLSYNYPDRPLHNFRASKSEDRLFLFSSGAPKLWKGPSGCMYILLASASVCRQGAVNFPFWLNEASRSILQCQNYLEMWDWLTVLTFSPNEHFKISELQKPSIDVFEVLMLCHRRSGTRLHHLRPLDQFKKKNASASKLMIFQLSKRGLLRTLYVCVLYIRKNISGKDFYFNSVINPTKERSTERLLENRLQEKRLLLSSRTFVLSKRLSLS